MPWFKKKTPVEESRVPRKLQIPEGLWLKCTQCREILYSKELERNLKVCPKCRYHFRLSSWERIATLADPESFQEHDARLSSLDPLRFKDSRRYRDRLAAAVKDTGFQEAVVCGSCTITGISVELCVMEFEFMGGSMGSAVGEKITRAIERARISRQSLIIVCCSGGARMQEGILSLMQMAKTSAALARLGEARVPYICVLADPTTGGVTASFGMLGDVIIAEPGALIGFAGPRVIEQTIREKLPEGFQRSEFLLEHGMLDVVVERKNLRETVGKLVSLLGGQPAVSNQPPVINGGSKKNEYQAFGSSSLS